MADRNDKPRWQDIASAATEQLASGDYERAGRWYRFAARLAINQGSRPSVAENLDGLARYAHDQIPEYPRRPS